jgi:putative DNA primase/helicase
MNNKQIQVQPRGMQDAVALAFARLHGDSFRYVARWNRWMQWDGMRWREERTHLAFDKARALLRASSDGAAKADAKTVAAIVTLAQADRMIAATHDQWDRDPWQLGTPGGIVDLRTGELRAASPDDYISKTTAVTPNSSCPIPLWRGFLERATNGDWRLQFYLQRVSGYMLTGDISEEAMFFSHGGGGNGKGTFWETVAGVMGDYHKPASMGMFTATQDRHATEVASLCGARLVTASETEEGRRWDENKIKTLTGGGLITAHFMRQDPFQFVPQFKLSVDSNHRPRIRTVDEAIRRRMNLIPWLVTIPKHERDRELKHKLRDEWPGILAWMIRGCRMWQSKGLNPPPVVVAATEEYLAAEDRVQSWLEECCKCEKQLWSSSSMIWQSWKDRALHACEYVETQRWLIDKLQDRGFTREKRNGVRGLCGLQVVS